MTERICGQGSSWLVGRAAIWSWRHEVWRRRLRSTPPASPTSFPRPAPPRWMRDLQLRGPRCRFANLRIAQAVGAKQPKRASFRAAAGAKSIRSDVPGRCTTVARPRARDRHCTHPKVGASPWQTLEMWVMTPPRRNRNLPGDRRQSSAIVGISHDPSSLQLGLWSDRAGVRAPVRSSPVIFSYKMSEVNQKVCLE